jgi:hypothetical protein
MTDDMTSQNTQPEMGSKTDDSFAWTEPEPAQGDAGTKAREWMAQLQAMIENLATQAAPVVREVGAKAAELAAIDGDKGGPVAAKAAEMTGNAGQKLAVKSRELAGELRRDAATAKGDATDVADQAAADLSETAADVAEATQDAVSEEPTTSSIA